jgi:hypothetical protein
MGFKVKDFKKLLVISKVTKMVPLLVGLSESGYTKFLGSTMLRLVHDSNPDHFFNNYEDALSTSLISITENAVALKLREIIQQNGYNTIDLLVVSCQYAETFHNCAIFLNNYYSETKDIKQASKDIIEGIYMFL